jgi:hypothetical protein
MSRRIVIKESCEHGQFGRHYLNHDPAGAEWCDRPDDITLTEPSEEMVERAGRVICNEEAHWINPVPDDFQAPCVGHYVEARAALSAALFGSSPVLAVEREETE